MPDWLRSLVTNIFRDHDCGDALPCVSTIFLPHPIPPFRFGIITLDTCINTQYIKGIEYIPKRNRLRLTNSSNHCSPLAGALVSILV